MTRDDPVASRWNSDSQIISSWAHSPQGHSKGIRALEVRTCEITSGCKTCVLLLVNSVPFLKMKCICGAQFLLNVNE